eukprot:363338-Chlamydomonas_euryale.AAC.5
MSGYNSAWALHTVHDVFGDLSTNDTALVTVCLGANDAVIKGVAPNSSRQVRAGCPTRSLPHQTHTHTHTPRTNDTALVTVCLGANDAVIKGVAPNSSRQVRAGCPTRSLPHRTHTPHTNDTALVTVCLGANDAVIKGVAPNCTSLQLQVLYCRPSSPSVSGDGSTIRPTSTPLQRLDAHRDNTWDMIGKSRDAWHALVNS